VDSVAGAGLSKIVQSASDQAGVKRPNKYYEVSQGEGPGGISLGSATVCDGANVFTYVEALKQALRGPAPTDLAELSKALSPEIPLEVNEVSLMAGINPLENLGSVSLNGTEDVNGRSCYVLDLDFQPQKAQESVKGLLQKEEQSKEPPKEMPFRATGGKERLWVDTQDYLIRKLRLDMQMDLRNAAASLFGGQALSYAMPEAMDKTVIQTYSDVRLNENLPDDWFAFHIPEGVKIVDHLDFSSLLYDIMGGE
jgi:outer membrane lipoprotein-sorting protein